jgi:hypothetical protein
LPGLVTARLVPLSAAKRFLKERVARAEEVTAKATAALRDVSKNYVHECFLKLYEAK